MFCKMVLPVLAALATSSAAPPPAVPHACVCTFNYAPVCGTDHVTYSNECALKCAQTRNTGLVKSYNGACQELEQVKVAELPNCVCTRNYKPVCGTDGHTYNNQCLLSCAQNSLKDLDVSHPGPCELVKVVENAENSDSCTRNLKPVCGTNGVTYNNPCLLNCVQEKEPELHVLHEGFCEESQAGSDDQLRVVDNLPNHCSCTRNLRPVCGTDGKTYHNQCLLNCAQIDKKDLLLSHTGACDQDNAGQVKVVADKVKVVDSVDQVKVVDSADQVKVVDIADQVQVAENVQNPCTCTRHLKPVCGTDGATYNNACLLHCARATNQGLHVAYEGFC